MPSIAALPYLLAHRPCGATRAGPSTTPGPSMNDKPGARRRPRSPSGRLPAALAAALFCFVALPQASAQEPPTPEPGPSPAPQTPPSSSSPRWFSGRSWTRYWQRWTKNDTDRDLFETLSFDLGDAATDPLTVHFMGRLAADLDGYDNTFGSLSDSYGRRTDALLYDLYVDLHSIDGFDLVRVGRQSIYETPETAYFDGLHVESEKFGRQEIQVGAYVGASTHLYESSHSGDLTAGAYVQGRPWQGGRLRFDYMRLEDRALLMGHDNDLLSAGFWQQISEPLQFEAQYSRIENRDRDVRGRLFFTDAGSDLLLQASYYRLLNTQGSLALEADPFFNSVHELFPYAQYGLMAAKGLCERWNLQGGVDLRRVDDRSDVGTYNRDFDRYYFTVSRTDCFVEGLTASVTADFWNSDGQLVRSWGGSLDKSFDKLTATLGTYYSLYKFDLFSDRERDHVRTWFGRLRYKTSKDVRVDLDYELEDDDQGRTHTVRMGVSWLF